MATDVDLGEFNLGSVDRLRFPITKDSVAWLGADSVLLTFLAPDGTSFSRDATLEMPDAGVWYYDTTVTDFPVSKASAYIGGWLVAVTVTNGAIVKTYPYEVGFRMHNRPYEP